MLFTFAFRPRRGVFDYVPPPYDTAADALAFAAEKAREKCAGISGRPEFQNHYFRASKRINTVHEKGRDNRRD
jgi:hypothetical protein